MRNVKSESELYLAERDKQDRPGEPAPGEDVRGVADDAALDDEDDDDDLEDEDDDEDEGTF
jgi:hypothetical protein